MPRGGAAAAGLTLEQLRGVWLRVERTVGAGPAEEPAEAVWAQAGRWFADVLPGGAVLGAAGEAGSIMVDGSVSEGRGRWGGLRLRSGLGRVPDGLAAALDPSVPAPTPWRRPQFGR